MQLKPYLDSRRMTHKEFGEIAGISPASLCNYLSGRRKPTIEAALKIQKATNGRVTVEDLLLYWKDKNQ